jgi:hypothetical protein
MHSVADWLWFVKFFVAEFFQINVWVLRSWGVFGIFGNTRKKNPPLAGVLGGARLIYLITILTTSFGTYSANPLLRSIARKSSTFVFAFFTSLEYTYVLVKA